MSESAIRAQIVTSLDAVANIGEVTDQAGRVGDWAAKLPSSPFAAVVYSSISERYAGLGGDVDVTYHFAIYVYLQVNRERHTETFFRTLVEAIRDKFRHDTRLTNTCDHCGPIQLRGGWETQNVMVGSVLCHRAIFDFPCTERKEAV